MSGSRLCEHACAHAHERAQRAMTCVLCAAHETVVVNVVWVVVVVVVVAADDCIIWCARIAQQF